MAQLNDISIGAIPDDDTLKHSESIAKQVNEWGRRISAEDRTKIIKDASGTQRILFGEGQNQFYGMKVSQSGYDVGSATDAQLIFNSNQNVFKIVKIMPLSLDIPLSGGSGSFGSTTQAHGLIGTPAHQAFITVDPFLAAFGSGTTNGPNPTVINAISGTSVVTIATSQVTVDATNVIFTAYVGVIGSLTLHFSAKVYILQETAA